MVQMAFSDLSHTFCKQVTNVSQHVFVILLWEILTSPLTNVFVWVFAVPTIRNFDVSPKRGPYPFSS